MLKGMVLSTLLAGGVLTSAMALEGSGPRSVEIKQVGKGFTIKCTTEHGVYAYFEDVAKTAEEAVEQTRHCLTTKIRPEWGQ